VNHADAAAPPTDVLSAFDLVQGSLRRAATGLINQTWYASDVRGLPRVL
jgi:hypothetical protein